MAAKTFAIPPARVVPAAFAKCRRRLRVGAASEPIDLALDGRTVPQVAVYHDVAWVAQRIKVAQRVSFHQDRISSCTGGNYAELAFLTKEARSLRATFSYERAAAGGCLDADETDV